MTKVICLMGPTASGKTALACELAQRFPVEIISIDSGLIYREMDIGTAKPEAMLLSQAPHHLIDILDPPERYSAAQCCQDVQRCCEDIVAKGKVPLLVGGTMMYFRALQFGLSDLPEADPMLREQLTQQAAQYGWSYMHQQLGFVDPVSAARIHPHDAQRIQRALEIYYTTKIPWSEYIDQSTRTFRYPFINILLMPSDRSWLHQRIAERFKNMLAQGFVEEVEQLVARWKLTLTDPSLRCVGYRQVYDYLQGEYDKETLLEKGISATRQLAKRQLTWLRHWDSGTVIEADNESVSSLLFQCMNLSG